MDHIILQEFIGSDCQLANDSFELQEILFTKLRSL